jgi:hypothetical protein
MFDGVNWLPLQRLSDVELPLVFRHGQAAKQPAHNDPDDVETGLPYDQLYDRDIGDS